MAKTPTWRDTPYAKPFYKSRAWQSVRELVLSRSHGLCEECLKHDVVRPADVVHHVIPLSADNVDDPSITLNPDKLVALCHDCHSEVHRLLGVGAMNGEKEEKPRVRFDAEGNVVRL